MHQNDRRFLSRMISNVDPMLIPLYESLLVDHFSLRKEWRLNAWDQLRAGASDQVYITIWNAHALSTILTICSGRVLSKEDKRKSSLLALIRFLQFLDLDLAHLKHGLHHALRLRVVLIIQPVAKHRRNDLPENA